MNKTRRVPLLMLVLVVIVALGAFGGWFDAPDSPCGSPPVLLMPAAVLALRAKRKELTGKLKALAEKDALTAAEDAEYTNLRAQAEALAKQIERHEFVEGEESALAQRDPNPGRPDPEASTRGKGKGEKLVVVPNPGFENLGELLYCRYFQPQDSRIVALLEMGGNAGIAIPDEFNPLLREVKPKEAIVRPRATVIPAGDSPDAGITMPVLDQGSGSNMHGGVAVDWIAEGQTKPETNVGLVDVTLEPKEVAGHIVVTDKLLRNWAAASAVIDRLFRSAILAAEDYAFLRGNGIGRPLGIIASPALKRINRAVANQVSYADLVAMEAAFFGEGDGVWIVNPAAVPKFRLMEDTEGHLIWQNSAREGAPDMLFGRPVLRSFRSPALGSLGDVLLADCGYYLIKDGVQLSIEASKHVYFIQNKTVVKAFKSVDGAPWLDGPLLQEDGATYSPFVGLDVPA